MGFKMPRCRGWIDLSQLRIFSGYYRKLRAITVPVNVNHHVNNSDSRLLVRFTGIAYRFVLLMSGVAIGIEHGVKGV